MLINSSAKGRNSNSGLMDSDISHEQLMIAIGRDLSDWRERH
jgi:hypothetical protein